MLVVVLLQQVEILLVVLVEALEVLVVYYVEVMVVVKHMVTGQDNMVVEVLVQRVEVAALKSQQLPQMDAEED